MAVSRPKLPLHVLPAFEAAARHGSFRAAATELHLTPSAISHQIRSLEESVGVALFHRLPRGLQLTEAGRKFAATVGEALAQLEATAGELCPKQKLGRLLVSVPDFVAHYYVLPALSRFRERHPELDLEINATMELADVEAGKVDAAVRIGMGSWGSLSASLITELLGTIIAAPGLAGEAGAMSENGGLPIVCLSQLENHTRETLAAAGLKATPDRALRVNNYMAVVQAVAEGLGVAVVYDPPGKPFDFDGQVVSLSGSRIPAPFAMYFVCRSKDAERPEVAALRQWLTECIVS